MTKYITAFSFQSIIFVLKLVKFKILSDFLYSFLLQIVDSIISHGSFINDSLIEHSLVGIRSRINSNAHLKVQFCKSRLPSKKKPYNPVKYSLTEKRTQDTVMLGADFYETDVEVSSLLAEGRVPIGIGENTKIKYT